MRAIIFLLFVILIFLIIRFTLNRIIEIRDKQRAEEIKQQQQQNPTTDEDAHQEMVRCAFCGVHLPQSEAYYDGKDTFCSEGHMHEYHQQNKHDE